MLNKANAIPKEIRPDIKKVMDRNSLKLKWNTADVQYLFTVYNRYIAMKGEPEDVTCSGCRTKVIGKFRIFVQQWFGSDATIPTT